MQKESEMWRFKDLMIDNMIIDFVQKKSAHYEVINNCTYWHFSNTDWKILTMEILKFQWSVMD